MINRESDNALAMALDTVRHVWRHRKGNEVPAAVLDTFEALNFETKKGMRPVLAHRHKTENGCKLIFNLPPGISMKDVENKLHYFEEQAGGSITLKMNGSKLHMDICVIDLPKEILYEWVPENYSLFSLPIPIGHTPTGLKVIDLAKVPHLFVAGNTGSGKSNAIHVFINALLTKNTLIIIIDLKRVEFSYLRNHAIIANTESLAIQAIELLNREMDRRLEILEEKECVNVTEYTGSDMPYIVLVIDELGELRDRDAQEGLNRLARLSRAAGISIIAATQRPSATLYKNFTDTRALFAGRLCYSVVDEINSMMVLGNDMADKIPKDIPGRGVFQWDEQIIIQSMYLPLKEAKKNIKSLSMRKVEWVEYEQRSKRLLPR